MYQKGFAVKQICQQIEIKSKSTLYKYLQLENIPLRSFSKN
ncbi:helix-turn-helix domain-containing protein [Odoribacter splanchnicus]|nr:helix-turn-helix domain-containing protein [Odoribacter splanchnicus]